MTKPPSESESPRAQSLPRLTLRNKLLVFAFALVVLPGLLLAALATRNASAALEAQAGSALAREADHTAEQLSAVLRGARQTLASFARQDLMRDVRVGDVDKRVSMALATLRAGQASAHDYYVLDAEERVVAASDPSAIGTRPAWAFLLRNGGPREGIVGPVRAPAFASPRVLMASTIPDPDDSTRSLGSLAGAFDWSVLTVALGTVQRDLAAQEIPADVLVCDAEGTILRGVFASETDARARELNDAARGLRSEPDWVALHDSIVGRAALAPDLPRWGVLVIEQRAHALAPVTSLQRRMALTLGVALALALAAAAVASRRVVRPLSELTAAIRGLARGGAGSVPVRSDDEVGALAGAFNRMSADLARAQHDLVEAEKFAFVGELAAGVAHEIRTSLGVLKSSAQILDRSRPADANPELRELTEMVRDEVVRLGGVVDDLLTLKPERALRLEPGPLSPLLARAADFARPAAREKGVRVVCPAPPADEPLVAREPELIHQVAVNLLVNAVQALAEGGSVEIAVLPAHAGCGGFEVRDDGPGIPEALRERIFQPFVTGRSGGVGLGLTFVKRVVHEHRGRIALESAPGAGTRVRIELPLAEAAR
ncbi:MAG TPA: HAMP domain-containing sensor histidine kinase [Myxococcota bacterium]|nr:HAMP domain-containing sensor histidine kinase [Myxococcota bacterium]